MSDGPSGGRVSLHARMAAAGLDVEPAERRLREAGLWGDDGGIDDLLGALSDVAGPMDALVTITELASHQPDLFTRVRRDEGWLRRIVAVGGTSRPLGELIARHADAADVLRDPARIEVADVRRDVEQAVADAAGRGDQAAGVAAIRRQATARIASRDLAGDDDVDTVAAELAALAEGVLSGALAALHREVAGGAPRARIGVIGMGKLGGRELNYVSDVDVIFVHAATSGADDQDAAAEARTVLESLLRLLNASTTMGRAYEVDPTLRPEGRAGALSRTVESYQAYWERWAKTWEFQALIKARHVAGDEGLVADLLARAEPFVFPEELEPSVIAEVREMKSRVEAKPEVQRHGERQVKLGPGGLRDIEFAVQLLQLVHGRADRRLRVTGTVAALHALAEGGYVADEDAETFADAYRRLRTVEHRLQLAHERRTHTIPDDEARQEWLARSLGYRPQDEEPAREAFLRDLRRVQGEVRDLHAKLFYRPLLEAHASVPAQDAGVALPHEVRAIGDDAAITRLAALGFRDAGGALRHLRTMTAGVSRRARTLRAILPPMLHVLSDSPDPDTGLRMLRTLVEAHGRTSRLLPHLRDHPPAADLLARVLGTSEVAGELLLAQPQGVEWLLDPEVRREPRTRDQLTRLALNRLEWQDATAALRRFKRHELLRIVLRDVAGSAVVSVVGEELTALGEACLEAALRGILDTEAREAGNAAGELPARIAVIGLGRLGGRELNYASDLDVMFVHEPAPGASEEEATALALSVAERVVKALGEITAEGTAFEVDVDLRPEGKQGPLSRSLESYLAYYGRWSEPWEHQALLKARVVAGDGDLGARFVAAASELAYPSSFGDADVQRMRKMKARIERERVPRRADPKRHLKLGPGGLSDVEWVTQLLQQRHGHGERRIRATSTMGAIDALQDAALLDHRDASWLREGYRFLSEIRNGLYLLRQRNVDELPSSADLLERLARSLGYGRGGRQELDADYLRHTRHVRRVTERVFYGVDPEQGQRWE